MSVYKKTIGVLELSSASFFLLGCYESPQRILGVLDVFMFLSSTGGCKNSTWLELGVRDLLLYSFFCFLYLSALCSVNLSSSLLCSSHHLSPLLYFSAPPQPPTLHL